VAPVLQNRTFIRMNRPPEKRATSARPGTVASMNAGSSHWLTVDEVLEHLTISRSTWDKWRQKQCSPKAKRLPNGSLRIRADWLDEWLDQLPEEAA
jgi:predicted DNA-binding transcriptional regulator AlpA